ncbi:hypothetical protein [Azospirillum rugosum]|uniref:Uncharacterized protein n=1 Tax=Azospirillum rugosum TaxID=416170 RepID=A0ABS4SEU2_9PROT|nr:hypothetical protein [Azospirillum rugosum]MBP2290704.1 hypothetical protein [Azospirillum rugosum]MDQ0525592.1 hypothetical protein [Azospirillum rugosum]
MQTVFHHIRLAEGPIFYAGEPISLADAQVMINDGIMERRLSPGSFLRVAGVELLLEQAGTAVGDHR